MPAFASGKARTPCSPATRAPTAGRERSRRPEPGTFRQQLPACPMRALRLPPRRSSSRARCGARGRPRAHPSRSPPPRVPGRRAEGKLPARQCVPGEERLPGGLGDQGFMDIGLGHPATVAVGDPSPPAALTSASSFVSDAGFVPGRGVGARPWTPGARRGRPVLAARAYRPVPLDSCSAGGPRSWVSAPGSVVLLARRAKIDAHPPVGPPSERRAGDCDASPRRPRAGGRVPDRVPPPARPGGGGGRDTGCA
jgi:hypothetical protein